VKKWLERLYQWWVIGDWRLAKDQVEFNELRRAMTKRGG
jgi:hypothetical protein